MPAVAKARTTWPCALVLLLGAGGALRASTPAAGGLAPVPSAALGAGQLPVHDGIQRPVPAAPGLDGRLTQVHARLHEVDARIRKLTELIDRYSELWDRSQGTARLVITAFTQRWMTERRAEYRERFALEDEARSLEGALFAPPRPGAAAPRCPPSSPPVPEEGTRQRQVLREAKAKSPGTADPWFAILAEPGTLQRPHPLPAKVISRCAPDELALDPEGGLAYLYRETGTAGRIHPQTDRNFYDDIQRGLSQVFGLCPTSSRLYLHVKALDGQRRMCPLEPSAGEATSFALPELFRDDPISMREHDQGMVVIWPSQIGFFVPDPRGGASAGEGRLQRGEPLKPGSLFTKSLEFIEPGTGVVGSVHIQLAKKGSTTFTVQRRLLPKGGIATGLGAAPWNPGKEFYVTDAERDLLYRVQSASLAVETLPLRRGTRPGEMCEGPEGSLLFATANGFGCVTAAGEVNEIALGGGRAVEARRLVYDPGCGKLFFLQPGHAEIFALQLCTKVPSKDGRLVLTCGAVLKGPSLLAARETWAPLDPSRMGAAPALGCGESKAVAVPASASGSAPGAEPAPDLGLEPDDLDDKELEEIATEGEDAGPTRAAATGGMREFLGRWRIPHTQYRHVKEAHAQEGPPTVGPDGRVKSRFSPDTIRIWLGSFRNFKRFARAVLDLKCLDHRFEGDRALVLEFSWAEGVGLVWDEEAGDWVGTDRLRLALALGEDDRFFLTSFYPIPKP